MKEKLFRSGVFRWFLLASVLVLALGLIEDLYGNTDDGDVYGSDAVQYLDIARAMERGDMHSALNPLWSQGYPALIAVARPVFGKGPSGDWADTRVVNFVIFTADYLAFLYLLFGLVEEPAEDVSTQRSVIIALAAFTFFLATQLCLGQVSRVNPDELLSTFFFLCCGLAARLLRTPARARGRSLFLGLALGTGFLVKAAFLPLGLGLTALTAAGLLLRRRSAAPLFATVVVLVAIAGFYGHALSKATGYRTLGESGAINYAWHVNRLEKWVHWEGGAEPASKAWPKPWIARFAQWDTHPPDFGSPLHPSRILQRDPVIYGFSAPFHATYTPYFDPPYWYQGYRHFTRSRYQLIAIAKNLGDLLQSLARQPAILLGFVALLVLLMAPAARHRLRAWGRVYWPLVALALLGVTLYLPVHLEGRYLASFFAVGLTALFVGAATDVAAGRFRLVFVLLAVGLLGDLAIAQSPVFRNLLHRKSAQKNMEWSIAEAVLAQHLPAGSAVGDISWTPNLHSDWAYMSRVEITSEIATPQDLKAFWAQPEAQQRETLRTFHRAGAVAVFTRDKPSGNFPGWRQLGDTPMWMYRF